jgi:ketosteroid isomerase-like protein
MRLALLFACSVLLSAQAPSTPARVLDAWHAAAAKADEEAYFEAMHADSVFLGTDATERWSKEAFRAFAHPHFAKGKAWSFKATRRDLAFSPTGELAWFDEDLATANLGPCRGSGVLIKEKGIWKILQYNLSVPIPNGLMNQVKALIETAK